MKTQSALKSAATFATILVSAFYVSSYAEARPANKPREFSEVKFSEIRPRLLLQASAKKIDSLVLKPDLINARGVGYTSVFNFTKTMLSYPEKSLFRVIYVSRSQDYTMNSAGTALEDTGYALISATLQPVNSALQPAGAPFEIATKAKGDDVVPEFLADKNDRIARLSDLVYKRAKLDDILANTLPIRTVHGTIPANSYAIVKGIEKERASWSFAYDYTLTVLIKPCPDALRAQRCLAKITSVGFMPDSSWGHWVNPKNITHSQIFGFEFSH